MVYTRRHWAYPRLRVRRPLSLSLSLSPMGRLWALQGVREGEREGKVGVYAVCLFRR